MPVVSLINRKGGVGKTTLTLALADFLAASFRKRVLLIDLDAQANLSVACIGESQWDRLERAEMTLADTFRDVVDGRDPRLHIETVHRISGAVPVSLLVSTPRLQDVEEEAMEGDPAWRMRVGSPYLVLHNVLLKHIDQYDVVLVDCPPALRAVSLNGIAISHGYLLPVMPSPVSIAGLKQVITRLDAFAKGLRRPLLRYGTVVNRFSRANNLHASVLGELKKEPGFAPIWNSIVGATVGIERGYADHEPRTLVQRWGPAYSDLSALAEEFVRRVR